MKRSRRRWLSPSVHPFPVSLPFALYLCFYLRISREMDSEASDITLPFPSVSPNILSRVESRPSTIAMHAFRLVRFESHVQRLRAPSRYSPIDFPCTSPNTLPDISSPTRPRTKHRSIYSSHSFTSSSRTIHLRPRPPRSDPSPTRPYRGNYQPTSSVRGSRRLFRC